MLMMQALGKDYYFLHAVLVCPGCRSALAMVLTFIRDTAVHACVTRLGYLKYTVSLP